MPYKTIAAQCDGRPSAARRLEVAVNLAERFDSYLVGVHAKPPFVLPIYADGYDMAPLFEIYEEGLATEAAVARAAWDHALKGGHLSSEWRSRDGLADDVLSLSARYADLVLVGQTEPPAGGEPTTPPSVPETVALASGRPILAVPHVGLEKPIGGTVMLCWNASRESARAASDAMPFLQAPRKVIVLLVEPRASDTGHGEEPGADVATWLARHGVNVVVQREVAADADVGNIILSRAADYDVDLIVMGIYGHSRMRELVLGGVSRTLLATMTVPVLMAH